ncbi:hypothetical protein RFI_24824 [Reticulomyxa filosa]|uniref:Uncharacterized protein n=1 Tax=Reticulomyxa filosa TaxID=46433 RepID=X6MHK3_RETFI|nr:hypothetical protein RFI_24824 [Reticulomyxa filosa]|eukprot:ETO12550.1 hypothetical protein RFI_24824 [Reticulomyxa filosa]
MQYRENYAQYKLQLPNQPDSFFKPKAEEPPDPNLEFDSPTNQSERDEVKSSKREWEMEQKNSRVTDSVSVSHSGSRFEQEYPSHSGIEKNDYLALENPISFSRSSSPSIPQFDEPYQNGLHLFYFTLNDNLKFSCVKDLLKDVEHIDNETLKHLYLETQKQQKKHESEASGSEFMILLIYYQNKLEQRQIEFPEFEDVH